MNHTTLICAALVAALTLGSGCAEKKSQTNEAPKAAFKAVHGKLVFIADLGPYDLYDRVAEEQAVEVATAPAPAQATAPAPEAAKPATAQAPAPAPEAAKPATAPAPEAPASAPAAG